MLIRDMYWNQDSDTESGNVQLFAKQCMDIPGYK